MPFPGFSLPQGQTIGQRTGLGAVTIPASGISDGITGVSSADPAAPANQMIVPALSPTVIQGPSISDWVFDATPWTATLDLHGTAGLVDAGMSINVTVQEHDSGGGYTTRGTLAGITSSFDASGLATLTATGTAAFTAGTGSSLVLIVALTTSDWSLFSGDTAAVAVGSLTVNPGGATLPSGATYVDPGTPAAPVAPTSPTSSSRTGMPWPDPNNPGMAPSSCETPGCDFPASRINFPMGLALTQATMSNGRATKHLQAIHSLFDGANFRRLWMDEFGVFQTMQKPFYTSTGVPAIEWTFSNESPSPDGYIVSLSRDPVDLAAAWNIEFDVSLANGAGKGIFAKRTNDDPASVVSRVHMKRPATHVQQNDKIVVQTQLDDIADAGIQQGMSGVDALKAVIPFNPFFQSYDTVNIRWIDQRDGSLTVDGSTYPYTVTYWKQTLRSQSGPVTTMDLTAERDVILG